MRNKGFSFIELLVAVAILGIISLPIASSFALAAQIDAKARAVSAAGNAADDVLLLISEIDDLQKDTLSDAETQVSSWIYEGDLSSYASEQNQYIISDLLLKSSASGDWEYTFCYNGYDVVLKIADCSQIFRVDISLTYHVSGDTMTITRKGVLSK